MGVGGRSTTLSCPRCSARMEPYTTPAGPTAEMCAGCGTVFFDEGELGAVLGTAADLPDLERTRSRTESTEHRCPRCAAAWLVRQPYALGEPVAIETCPACRGVLVSLADLSALRPLAGRFPGAPSPASRASSPGSVALARRGAEALAAPGSASVALANASRAFERHAGFSMRQKKRWAEILFDWESKNSYVVKGAGLENAFQVVEQGQGLGELLSRVLLGPMRPFESHVEDGRSGRTVLQLRRRFRFVFQRLEIFDADGVLLGAIERRWSWLRRIYVIEDPAGRVVGDVFGPLLSPWTFELRSGGRQFGTIRKRWGGVFKEAFSDADDFTIEFGGDATPEEKLFALATAVLVDVVHFERKG